MMIDGSLLNVVLTLDLFIGILIGIIFCIPYLKEREK